MQTINSVKIAIEHILSKISARTSYINNEIIQYADKADTKIIATAGI